MRNFRKAALAGATAVAVATGSMSVAVAEDAPKAEGNLATKINREIEGYIDNTDGSKAGDVEEKEGVSLRTSESEKIKDTGVTWNQFWNWTDGDVKDGGTPIWVKLLSAGGIAVMVSAVVGLIVGPLYNYIVHGM